MTAKQQLDVTIKDLLEAGAHFGHQKSRWNPKMRPYIFGVRSKIHIIDLRKTMKHLKDAYEVMKSYSAQGKSILFVGTKRQIKDIIADEAQRAKVFWVSERWLGGMLTNFRTIRLSVQRLRQIERMFEDKTVEKLTKKEAGILRKKQEKLSTVLGGVREMEKVPDIIYLVDTMNEKTTVLEAKTLGIPVVAIVDSNCDPDVVDHIIPGNDDAIKSVRLITSAMADAIIDGRSGGQLGSSFAKKEDKEKTDEGEVVEEVGEIPSDTVEKKDEQSENTETNE